MSKIPKVSVIMSCYKSNSKWLEESIMSVISQTFKKFEFIIINDGSNKKDVFILKKFKKLDNRIRIINKKKNTGLADSLNLGIKSSKGKWIARVDADDILHKNRLEKQIKFLEKNKKYIFLGTFSNLIDHKSKVYGKITFPENHNFLVNNLLLSKKFPVHSSAIFLKSKALKVGLYRKRFQKAQDRDLWLRLSEIGKIHCLPEFLVSYRYHRDQLSYSHKGYHQVTYAHLAIQSYFFRINHYPDPINYKKKDFDVYLEQLSKKLIDFNILKINEISREIKKNAFYKKSSFEKFFFLFLYLISNPLIILKIIILRYIGEKKSYQIFKENIKNIKS